MKDWDSRVEKPAVSRMERAMQITVRLPILVNDGALVVGVVVLPGVARHGGVGVQVPPLALAVALHALPRLHGDGQLLPLLGRQVLVARRPRAPVVDLGRHSGDDEVVVRPEHADGDGKEEHDALEGPIRADDARQLDLLFLYHGAGWVTLNEHHQFFAPLRTAVP